MTTMATLPRFPLVGRVEELGLIRSVLEAASAGRGSTLVLTGSGGVGKSRLAQAAKEEAEARGWALAVGRANPVERGVPYSLFSDAIVPVIRRMDADTRQVLTRGVAELTYLFPALAPPDARGGQQEQQDDFKSRLLWHFTEFLRRLSARSPVLIVLEDLQWADASSLELLHFIARQLGSERVALVCTHNPEAHDASGTMPSLERSLVALGAARVHRLAALDYEATAELVCSAFDADEAATRGFAALLYGWTRGNPFFIQETLKSLVASGRLHRSDGKWLGWELNELELPRSIRDAVLSRLERLSAGGRVAAEYAAVVGMRVASRVLAAVVPLSEATRLDAVEELRRTQILGETLEGGDIVYEFTHPILRETIYTELGLTRARALHAAVAAALESVLDIENAEQVDVLAYHYARAHAADSAGKAIRYLTSAGASALRKHANREAADYFSAALERLDADAAGGTPEQRAEIVDSLARATQRLGDYARALQLLERGRVEAVQTGDYVRLAHLERRAGLALFWSGNLPGALERIDAGLAAARSCGDTASEVRLLVARGLALQESGQPDEAKETVLVALERMSGRAETPLLARVHRALLQLHVWTGPPAVAREHGRRALELATASGERDLAFSVHWAMGLLEGLTGSFAGVQRHVEAAQRIAEELRSPVLQAWIAELALEIASARGEWDTAIARGEQAIAIARALHQQMLLPRLLVWTGIVYLERNELARGKAYIDEAWERARADRPREPGANLHALVPAHIGRARYHLAIGDFDAAIAVGEAGLALADRSGYAVWAIHRLLPTIAEAHLLLRDVEGARRTGARLRAESERFGHVLGIAWADGCDALIAWLAGDPQRGAVLLRRAAEQLEAVPYPFDAARIRRQLAGRLADLGERDAAARELRAVHDVFMRLGAERELEKTRTQFRELGQRPPARAGVRGADGLTYRELEIVRLVADRKSNKAIGKELGISPRTVSTHLSHVFQKLEVGSRRELSDLVRTREIALPA